MSCFLPSKIYIAPRKHFGFGDRLFELKNRRRLHLLPFPVALTVNDPGQLINERFIVAKLRAGI